MVICIFIIAHLIADFTFQSASLAENKINHFSLLVFHAIVYATILSVAIFTFIQTRDAILPCIIIGLSHFLIDWARTVTDKKFKTKAFAFFSFLADQALHISIIFIVYFRFNLIAKTNSIFEYCQSWKQFDSLVVYLLIFAIIWDPAAVFIKKIFTYIIKGDDSVDENGGQQVGRIIGKLERAIISLLVLCNQPGAIGFVLTAKSIARYKQLENKCFAEKYLVGTLASTLISLVTASLLKNLL